MSHFQTLINYLNIFSYFYQNHYCYKINKLTLMIVSLRSYWSWYWNQWNLCTRILGWVNYIDTSIIHRYISQGACVGTMIVCMGWKQALYPSTNKKQLTLQYFLIAIHHLHIWLPPRNLAAQYDLSSKDRDDISVWKIHRRLWRWFWLSAGGF